MTGEYWLIEKEWAVSRGKRALVSTVMVGCDVFPETSPVLKRTARQITILAWLML